MKKTGKQNKDKLSRDILQELAAIGLARVTDCLDIRDGKVELKAVTGEDVAAIAAIEKTAGGWKLKFYDKLKALELLGDHLGLFGSSPVSEDPENNLLEAVLAATKEAINTDDIPEIQ